MERDRRLSLQLELLKKEKARLLSQLTAQESVIDGLRAERKIWGQELAHQGGRREEDPQRCSGLHVQTTTCSLLTHRSLQLTV